MGWLGTQVGSQQPHPGHWRVREWDHGEAGGRGSLEFVKLRDAKFSQSAQGQILGSLNPSLTENRGPHEGV